VQLAWRIKIVMKVVVKSLVSANAKHLHDVLSAPQALTIAAMESVKNALKTWR
jgi:hypothetical protein